MRNRKKMFISQVIESVKDFDSYKKISNYNISNSFKYFSILILIYAIITTIGITYNTCTSINEVQNFIQTEVSNLNYTEGFLSVNNDEYQSFYNNYVVINTSENVNIDEYNANFVLGRSEFIFKVEENRFKFKYMNFINQNFGKNDIIEALNVKNYIAIIIIVSLVSSYIVLGLSTLLDILIIALIGLIISGITGNNKFKFKNAFNISVHSVTLPIILGMIYFIVNTFTGFYIKYFSTMYTLIATIYIVTAILLINTDKSSNN